MYTRKNTDTMIMLHNLTKGEKMPNFSNIKKLDTCIKVTTLIFGLIVFLSAWNCDDAYHGFITVRNILNGNGFVYNIGERVNVCTCPLFVLILTGFTFIFREVTIVSYIICTAFSTAAFYIITSNFCKDKWQLLFTFFATTGSYCFMSFTTSGLENSLLFLELALFILVYSKNEEYDFKKLILLAFIDSLVLFTRMDIGFMLFVPTAYVFLFKKKCSFIKMFGAGLIVLIPFFIWEIFSAFYFGSWFPNPFYVKVGTSIPVGDYIIHGIQYLLISFGYDLVLIVFIFIAIVRLLMDKKLSFKMFAIGMIVKLCWVIYMGGDFMVGRHFTDLFFVSITWILVVMNEEEKSIRANDDKISANKWKLGLSIVLILCISISMNTRTTVMKSFLFPQNQYQCGEEKDWYYPTLGMLPRLMTYISEGRDLTDDTWAGVATDVVKEAVDRGDRAMISLWAPGVLVYKYNEKIYLVDDLALGDAFLSKFPSIYTNPWRVGHTKREVPVGYGESLFNNTNLIEDPDLRQYYDMFLEVTRGELFSGKRVKLAFEFAMGKYDYLIKRYLSRKAAVQ